MRFRQTENQTDISRQSQTDRQIIRQRESDRQTEWYYLLKSRDPDAGCPSCHFGACSFHHGIMTGHKLYKRLLIHVLRFMLFSTGWGWSGGAKVLGKLPVPGLPTTLITVGQGHTALAVGAGGIVWTFLLSSILSLLFLPLFGRRPDID